MTKVRRHDLRTFPLQYQPR
ncbi:hypothetical protein FKE98_03635 [Corynebacterium aurimucosum]|uniref:Protein quaking putative nuclear localisation signal domain-containing protein n=1 Tax=Corynebacterium guaraldiae TaxID=3051103 RepID=A0ABY3CTH6_9CORY|nr:hypothetical protein [Corynebacterium guaraldiae]HCT9179986.1 hypothetical protein [Corynebacterium aurimucosum]MTE09555.1 hypothetical protein [Corynebacterium guaraldiae]TRX34716.1 hypothetical protein FNY86_01180 [Corynebacterium guaraldiae]TRX39379.1 hypothetical protein FNY89_09145 [Corynebacterium guaraldiae]